MDYLRRERFNIIVSGNSYVGKTSLLDCYNSGFFDRHRPVIGRQYLAKTVDVFGNKVKLFLWDPDGLERYKYLPPSFYRGADCVVLTFDLTNMVSFQGIDYWLKDAQQKTTGECLFVLVGTKADKVDGRAVPHDMAHSFAESIGVRYLETSAKTSENVEALFQSIAETIFRNKEESERLAAESVYIGQERLDKDRCFGGVTP